MNNPEIENNDYINIYLWALSLAGIAVCSFSIVRSLEENIDSGFFILAFITIFIGSYLRIQIPRTKIHLSFSEVLIFYIMLVYGSNEAVLVATLETLYTAYSFRRRGITIKNKTILFNTMTGAVSTFLMALTVNIFLSSFLSDIEANTVTGFIALLVIAGIALFLYNSILVSIWTALKTKTLLKTLWESWFNYCINALVMYIAAALIAGLAVKAQSQLNTTLFLLTIAVSAVIYFTYRRYVDDIRDTSAKAEQAERARAEQAEKHIEELQDYIAEQDRISQALRESKEKFRHAAFHDTLTDLPNRNLFMESLKIALEKTKQRKNFRFAVLFLDINRFKTINDSLGHSIGDQLIFHVAKRLLTSVLENDLVARFGGDEFAFLLNNITDVEYVVRFVERIKDKILAPFNLNGRQVFTSFSIGIAMGNGKYQAAEEVLRDADIAMYHAKENNKSYAIFDKKMHTRAVTLLQIETDLRSAIERNELCMYYQPIVGLNSMHLSGFESLVRWNHPQRGLIPPGEFIPVSEETGLIVPMTLWILRTSCRQMVEWQRKYPGCQDMVISVNLSGKHFAQKDLVEQIRAILVETQINPACLKLELTESAMMENAERVILMLKQIKALRVQLSIDDFGTGYSSLSYLHRFPINTLKVDRSFVSTMEDGSENGEIVRTVIALAKTLKLNVVAEGIETIHQLHQLRILGCEYGQGYLFSRPVPPEEAEKFLQDKSNWGDIIPNQNLLIPVPTINVLPLQLAK